MPEPVFHLQMAVVQTFARTQSLAKLAGALRYQPGTYG